MREPSPYRTRYPVAPPRPASYREAVSTFDVEETVAQVVGYFDQLAAGEWDRHDANPAARVAFELHRRMLHRHVRPGMRVLEIGAGPGRFTRELAAVGARITVADISPVQLALNETTIREAGHAHAVDGWVRCDIRDVSRWRRGEFDAVIAFGGPISYTFEQAEHVTAGLLALLEPGGVLLASVMSLLGSWRIFLPAIVRFVDSGQATFDDMHAVWRTGDTRHQPGQAHVCRCFRAHDVTAMIEAAAGTVIEMSASGWAVHNEPEHIAYLQADPGLWQRFLDMEEQSCATPGALDGGTHILVAARAR